MMRVFFYTPVYLFSKDQIPQKAINPDTFQTCVAFEIWRKGKRGGEAEGLLFPSEGSSETDFLSSLFLHACLPHYHFQWGTTMIWSSHDSFNSCAVGTHFWGTVISR